MEGARVVADEEARRLTESLPKETRAALDLGQGDVIEIVPFHPAATFGAAPNVEDEVGSGDTYARTWIRAMTMMTMTLLFPTKPRCAR